MICDDDPEIVYRIKKPRRPVISRTLYRVSLFDWEWALDNSRREYLVRASTDTDHPMIAGDRADATQKGMKPYESITIIRLRDGKMWLFGGQTVSFPRWQNTDRYARRRLKLNEAVRARVSGGSH